MFTVCLHNPGSCKMAVESECCQNKYDDNISDSLQELYPSVNQSETPLPRYWSPKDKWNFIGLSQNNLRVHYKGKFFVKRSSLGATFSYTASTFSIL